MTKTEFTKKYDKLIKEAENLPRIESIKKLIEAKTLKDGFYSNHPDEATHVTIRLRVPITKENK
jgi:hypothetical protein